MAKLDNHDFRGKNNVQPSGKMGAQHIFGRDKLPQRTVAPESAGPDKDAEMKKRKMGAADVFARRR